MLLGSLGVEFLHSLYYVFLTNSGHATSDITYFATKLIYIWKVNYLGLLLKILSHACIGILSLYVISLWFKSNISHSAREELIPITALDVRVALFGILIFSLALALKFLNYIIY